MCDIRKIHAAIASEGFSDCTLHMIETLSNNIQNGHTNIPRYTIPEHAGLCTAGKALIGASIVADYAAASLGAGSYASAGQGGATNVANWQIDQRQEQLIEEWARKAQLWIENSESILTEHFGPKIAQGAEAKVYYREGDTSVVKERASIYATTLKALEAIALHNYLFPETLMRVTGFTRDSDGLLRIVLTQPYVRCLRLATKGEIDALAAAKGFHDNRQGLGVNYTSARFALEDMHPANVFIDEISSLPTCIDCIVKFLQ